MKTNQIKIALMAFGSLVVGTATSHATYSASYDKTSCDEYSYHGLKERYFEGTPCGFVDNNGWDPCNSDGIDCSEYVGRCWAINGYVGETADTAHGAVTASWYQGIGNTVAISQSAMVTWDTWVYNNTVSGCGPGGHMGLFASDNGDGTIHTREARGSDYGVLTVDRPKSDLTSWCAHYYKRASWGADGGATSTHVGVFVRGADGAQLKYTMWNGTGWSGFGDLDGTLTSEPGAVSWGPNHMVVFVRGNDSKTIKYRTYSSGNWSGWLNAGYPSTGAAGAPDVCSRMAGVMQVFVKGADGQLWSRYYDSTGWGNWAPQGGVLTSDPTCVATDPTRVMVAVNGSNGECKYRFWTSAAGWGGWGGLNGFPSTSPDSSSMSKTQITVFARAVSPGTALRYISWNNGTWQTSWTDLAGTLTSPPGAVSWANNRMQAHVRGNDGSTIKYRNWNGASWDAWATTAPNSLPYYATTGPDACSWSYTAGAR